MEYTKRKALKGKFTSKLLGFKKTVDINLNKDNAGTKFKRYGIRRIHFFAKISKVLWKIFSRTRKIRYQNKRSSIKNNAWRW